MINVIYKIPVMVVLLIYSHQGIKMPSCLAPSKMIIIRTLIIIITIRSEEAIIRA